MAKPISRRVFLKRMKAAGFMIQPPNGLGSTHRRFLHADGRTFSTSVNKKDVDPATVRDLEILEAGGSTRRG